MKLKDNNAEPTPPSGESCICCRNRGVLPDAKIPGMVDSSTILQCCERCIAALFLGGTHPHDVDAATILAGGTL